MPMIKLVVILVIGNLNLFMIWLLDFEIFRIHWVVSIRWRHKISLISFKKIYGKLLLS